MGEQRVSKEDPLIIKRYASRRLYNTETSAYVTLEEIAAVIRSGRDVQIQDLKTGDDLTRQYLLQIIAEHESRGDNILSPDLLNDMVRSYATQASTMIPDFLAASFEMMRKGQEEVMKNMGATDSAGGNPVLDAIRAQQEAFMTAMTAAMPAAKPESGESDAKGAPKGGKPADKAGP